MSENPLFVFVGFVGTYDAAAVTKKEMKKEVRANAKVIERVIDSA